MATSMDCAECHAFISNYRLADELCVQLTEKMLRMVEDEKLGSPEFRRVEKESARARSELIMAKEALRVHMESHARRLLN